MQDPGENPEIKSTDYYKSATDGRGGIQLPNGSCLLDGGSTPQLALPPSAHGPGKREGWRENATAASKSSCICVRQKWSWPRAPEVCRKLGHGTDVLPLAEGIRELARRPAHEGPGKRKRAPEETGCGSGVGAADFERGVLGKFLSPSRRRQVVEHVRQVLGVSEWWACQVLGQSRSTQRHRAHLRAMSPDW